MTFDRKPYGYSLMLDLSGCTKLPFTRAQCEKFLVELTDRIGMERGDLHFWDYEDDPEGYDAAPPHLKGASIVQFIWTSSIVLHLLDELQHVYVDLFSCGEFDPSEVEALFELTFGGKVRQSKWTDRGICESSTQ